MRAQSFEEKIWKKYVDKGEFTFSKNKWKILKKNVFENFAELLNRKLKYWAENRVCKAVEDQAGLLDRKFPEDKTINAKTEVIQNDLEWNFRTKTDFAKRLTHHR